VSHAVADGRFPDEMLGDADGWFVLDDDQQWQDAPDLKFKQAASQASVPIAAKRTTITKPQVAKGTPADGPVDLASFRNHVAQR